MAYRTILVIGASGFVGSHLVAQLAARGGCDIVVPTRRYMRARHLLPLPTVRIVETDIGQDVALAALLPGVDAVINLVGVLHSKAGPAGSAFGPAFARTHVELPRRIVAACAAQRVPRYLHMSALGAAADGAVDVPALEGRRRTGGASQPAVATTIFRPSVMFGPDDHFMNRFARLQKLFPVVPLAGADARFQPIYVDDVARAFIAALDTDATIGHAYELAGPRSIRCANWCGWPASGPVIRARSSACRRDWRDCRHWLLELLPGEPLMSRDNLDSMKIDNVASGRWHRSWALNRSHWKQLAPYYLTGRGARSPPVAKRGIQLGRVPHPQLTKDKNNKGSNRHANH